MSHSPVFRTTSTKYIVIPPSSFAHASPAGQSIRSPKSPSTQPDLSPTKMTLASQQAARLAQQRVAQAMSKGKNPTRAGSSRTRVSWASPSSPTKSSSPSGHASTARNSCPSISSSPSLGSQEISRTVETLCNMEDRLDDFLSNFHIPDHLDFISTHLDPQYLYYYSKNGPLTHLSITPQNSRVIALGELLNSLEQELGFVEANGDSCIEVRKQIVANRVNETTVDLEKRVHDLWWTAISEKASAMRLVSSVTAAAESSSSGTHRERSGS
ncbi:hypothetical protein C0995_010899 [Termitomyces sp. Mi166|nr:hypothetical protein C0995_010899 [Termitomyces sp. Mi166\